MKPQQPVGCEDFIKPSNAADRLFYQKQLRETGLKGWDARRTVKMKPQQPVGCEDFIKPSNAADRLLSQSRRGNRT